MIRVVLMLVAGLGVAGCFNPSYDNPTCGPAGECPSGQVCGADHVCHAEGTAIDAAVDTALTDAAESDSGTDAATTDAATPDAAAIDGALIDARPIDAAAIDARPIDAPGIDAPGIDAGGACGNGIVEAGEQCDDGNLIGTDDCTTACRNPVCGDGFAYSAGGEQCDDGNGDNTDSCPSTCRFALCGDGFTYTAGGEQCDDGNVIDTDNCTTNCRTAVCGDGIVKTAGGPPLEVCDDHNNGACGTCNATCTASITPRAAAGLVTETTASSHVDGEIVTINDGIHIPTVFEYDLNSNGISAGRVQVTINTGMGMGQVAQVLITAINSVGATLFVSAGTHSMGQFPLNHDVPTALGNRALTSTVGSPAFGLSGMSGGAAADCPAGTGCNSGTDCASGMCNATTHACQ
jgi:cysteine-rich repeat protein